MQEVFTFAGMCHRAVAVSVIIATMVLFTVVVVIVVGEDGGCGW